MFLPIRKACSYYGVCARTMYRWREAGKIRTVTTPNGHVLFDCSVFEENIRKNYCYCAVKSSQQYDFLKKQEVFLSRLFPEYIILKDIGSTLEEKENFTLLIDLILKNKVAKIAVVSETIFDDNDISLFKHILDRRNIQLIIPPNDLYKNIENQNKIISILEKIKNQDKVS